MTVKISIYRPQDFWLAAKADFPQLENPIVIQSPSRRAIHDVRSWSAIARAAATVGASIQHGEYKFDVTDWTAIEVAAEGLDETAVRILRARADRRDRSGGEYSPLLASVPCQALRARPLARQ